MIIISIFLIVVAADQLFRIRQKNIIEQHRFRLYALRDSLREFAIQGDVSSSNWVFQYLDSSISKTIDVLPTLSLWRAIVMVLFLRRDDKNNTRMSHLYRELKKRQNAPLAKIYGEYVAEVGFFVSRRHDTIYFSVEAMFRAFHCSQWLKRRYRVMKQVLTAAPETSTLPEFA